MRIVCWQTILMKYHTLFLSKIWKDVAKFAICCSFDWRFKGKYHYANNDIGSGAHAPSPFDFKSGRLAQMQDKMVI